MIRSSIKKSIALARRLRGWIRIKLFIMRGKRPWSKGYGDYKWQVISNTIADDTIINTFRRKEILPSHFGLKLDERIVEYPWVLSNIPPKAERIMDVGSTLNFEPIVNHSEIRDKKLTFANIYPEHNCFVDKGISYVIADARNLPFRDKYFDLVSCISTLEHIGMDNELVYTKDAKHKESSHDDYLVAIKEMLRVISPGGSLLITVPFGRYEDHGFFQQFDKNMIDTIIRTTNESAEVSYFSYDNGWNKVDDPKTLDTASYFDIRDGGDKRDLSAAEAVACIKIMKQS